MHNRDGRVGNMNAPGPASETWVWEPQSRRMKSLLTKSDVILSAAKDLAVKELRAGKVAGGAPF
jgi:hypothetical protein